MLVSVNARSRNAVQAAQAMTVRPLCIRSQTPPSCASLSAKQFRTAGERRYSQAGHRQMTCKVISNVHIRMAEFHSSCIRLENETVKVPQMAESISEGTLKQWNKKKGDFVKQDEEVATIETDKIDVSVNAPKSGTIIETLASEEDTVSVGQELFVLELGDSPSEGKSEGQSEQKPKEPEKDETQENKEKKGEKEEQEKKEKEEQDKEKEKQEEKQEKEKQDKEKQEKEKAQKEESEQKESKEKSKPEKKPKEDPKPKSSGKGSGAYSAVPNQPSSSQSTDKKPDESKSQSEPKKQQSQPKSEPGNRTETRVKMNRMRLRIAERLKQSQNTAASLTTFNEIDMTNLIEMRAKYKDLVMKKYGVKLGFMSAFGKAVCYALKECPAANASMEGPGMGDTMVYRDYVDLSVAVATPKGLVTPVVRNAESLTMVEIEQEIAELGKKARDNKLTLEDMAGGTVTISNGGVFGSLYGTPILNLPQTAVLGLHAIKDKPVAIDGKVEIRPIMVVALTYDHRILDGREAVTSLVKIKEVIEDPRRLLLEV